MTALNEHLTLTEAAKIAPGRPSTNCLWRWCRRGVLSRSGERVRLQHVRIGGKLYTTAQWITDFGQRLAESDESYFDLTNPDPSPLGGPSGRRTPQCRDDRRHREKSEQINRELREAGL